jgi:hypothetical protein
MLMEYVPPVDIVKYFLRMRFTMMQIEIFDDPIDKVVLKCPLDNLVQNIRGNEVVNIGTGEIVCKRLVGKSLARPIKLWFTYNKLRYKAVLTPQFCRIERLKKAIRMLTGTPTGILVGIKVLRMSRAPE